MSFPCDHIRFPASGTVLIRILTTAGLLLAVTGTAPAQDAIRKNDWFGAVLAEQERLAEAAKAGEPAKQADPTVKASGSGTKRDHDSKKDFPDQLSVREQRIEESAGIWKDPWKPGDWTGMAGRYARACGPLAGKAKEMAGRCASSDDLRTVRDLFYVQHAERRLAFAVRTLAFVEMSAPRPQLAAQLKALQTQLVDAREGRVSGEALYARACELRRQIILSHPLLDFPALLINKRTAHLPEHMCDQYLGRHSQAAPGLVKIEDWKNHPKETVLLEGKLPRGAVIQPSLSYDGGRVVFAFADHENPRTQKDSQLRGYFLYEYNFASGTVRQVTGTALDPMKGRDGRQTVLIEDMNPCYLPDGGIAFISTRSQQYGRCHGGRYVPSYTLYRAEADGSEIRPLSYNESNEWAPSVLPDGTLVYCRWDYVDRHDVHFQSLWTMRPDGTQTAHYYGNNSPAPCLISEPQAIPNTRKTVCTAAAHHGQTLGTIITVDPGRGQEHGKPLKWITPELGFPESGVPDGITRAEMPPAEDARPGRASTPWPISEDLFLCTYGDGRGRGSEYGIYLVDTLGGRELICRDSKVSCFDPIPLRPRNAPPVLPSEIASSRHAKTGVFSVQDVYRSTEKIPAGVIQAMRVNEIISQPTRQVPSRSAVSNEVVKKVLGTVPVNKDGSVAFTAPANTALQFQLLDANGMAVMTMRSLVYVQPGEKASCVGCHEPRLSAPPPGLRSRVEIRAIEPPAGPQSEGGLSFMRTVQPVLDRHCIACHGPDNPPKGIDLTGGFTRNEKNGTRPAPRRLSAFNVAYESLISAPGMVKLAHRNSQTIYSKPDDYFARAGKLAPMLLAGHPDKEGRKRVELDRQSFQRVADWLDLNAQFYGDYSFNRIENRHPGPEREKMLRTAIEKQFGAELAKEPYAMLVNVANPAESRILMAPLPVAAGGWGQIADKAYRGANDPGYLEMRRLVEASITPLQRRDVAGTCGHPEDCRCGDCWVRSALINAGGAPRARNLVRPLQKPCSGYDVPSVSAKAGSGGNSDHAASCQ